MSSTGSAPKSPILAAVGISFVIAIGSSIGSLDMGQVEEVATGQFLTRPLTEANQRNTEANQRNAAALATLEDTVGAISKDIDFVAKRAASAVRRNENESFDRFACRQAVAVGRQDRKPRQRLPDDRALLHDQSPVRGVHPVPT